MEQKKPVRKSPLVWYFLLAVFFAICSIPASKLLNAYFPAGGIKSWNFDFRWLYWVLLAFSVLCLLPLLNALMRILHSENKLPLFLSYFYSGAFEDKVLNLSRSFGERTSGLRVQVGIACCLIALISILLWKAQLLNGKETSAEVYDVTSRITGFGGTYVKDVMLAERDPKRSSPVAHVLYNSDDNNQTRYLRDCARIVPLLKKAGARAVLLDAPMMWRRAIEGKYIQALDSTGIVVYGEPEQFGRTLLTYGSLVFSPAIFTLPEKEIGGGQFLNRIKPVVGQMTGRGLGSVISGQGSTAVLPERTFTLVDVTMALLRKYRNYPDDLQPEQKGKEVLFGEYRIPVTSEGWMYYYRSPVLHLSQLLRVFTTEYDDSLQFQLSWGFVNSNVPTVAELERIYKDKIVMVDWLDRGSFMNKYYKAASYESALGQIISGRQITMLESSSILLILLCVGIAGLITIKCRGFLSVLFMIALGMCTIGVGTVAAMYYVFFDVAYPLFSIALAMLVLPGIKMVHDSRDTDRA